MTAEDYIPGDLYDDDYGDYGDGFSSYPTYRRPRPKTCNRCGETGLHWGKVEDRWRLFKDGKMHTCSAQPARSTLKPCPFCGGTADVMTEPSFPDYFRYRVQCTGCHVRTDHYNSRNEPIELWNYRSKERTP